jgi:CelD/BcsL family acetyltransferase involved in cellulose biosynthesis
MVLPPAYPLSRLAPDIAAVLGEPAEVRIYTSFEPLQDAWRALQENACAYGFQTYDWLAAWYRHLGQPQGWQVRLVTLTDAAGRLQMLLPLGVRHQQGVRVLSFLGGEVTDYHAPLLRRDFPTAVFAQLWPALVKLLRADADLLRVRRMPHSIEGLPNPMISLAGMQATEQAHAATLTASFAEFQKLRSAKMFADTRRQLRRLQELGTVQLLVDVPLAQRAEVVAGMARQKARRWHETGSRDLFAEPGYLDFYQSLAVQGLGGGAVVVSALYVDAHLVATHWGICYAGRYYWIMPGYEDGNWGRYSVGRILMDAVVQDCIARGLAIFDLTVGDEAYKQQWADHTLALYAGQQGFNLRGKLVVLASEQWQRWRARARNNLRLRNLVRRLRGRAPLTSA